MTRVAKPPEPNLITPPLRTISMALMQVGDVVVVKTVRKTPVTGPPVEALGHVAIWTGTVWVSDFVQPGGRDPNVYRHSSTDRVVQYEIYRYSG